MRPIILDPLQWGSEAGDAVRIQAWLVAEGDHVQMGEPLASVLLGQQPLDVRSPCTGVLEEILVPAGETFAPGAVLARVIET
jgi:pyruvate/2-oxoglutarate dehydrogenase complex dihydrolipoamide acyltransferase (E2) component